MFVELRGALVFIKHGEAKLLDLLKVVVHLKLHSKHWIQVVHSCFSAAELKDKKQGERKTFKAKNLISTHAIQVDCGCTCASSKVLLRRHCTVDTNNF